MITIDCVPYASALIYGISRSFVVIDLIGRLKWTRKLIFFQKIMLGLLSSYLQEYLNPCNVERMYSTRSSNQSVKSNSIYSFT